MIISLGGAAGSGKTTIAKRLAEELGYNYYDIGDIRRQMALKQGISLAELNKKSEVDPESDLEVDNYQTELGKTEDNFVITSRNSWHFIPYSLKIFLDVSYEEAAKRIINDENHKVKGENFTCLEEAIEALKNRAKSDDLRYKKYFQIDIYDKNNYDFYLDTTNLNQDQVFLKVLEFVKGKMS